MNAKKQMTKQKASKEVQTEVKQPRLLKVLQRPHMSEKATIIGEKHNQFVFQVMPEATKTEIKHAVEMLFDVKVQNVRICNVRSKERRFKQMMGQRNGWKKAYVALKEGQDLNFVGTK